MFNTLGDVCLFIRNGFPYKPSENGLPVTRIETISSGVINFEKVGFAEPDSKINQFKMEPGDILFSNINSPSHLGKVAFYDEVNELYHGMNLLCLRIKKDIAEPKYIYYLLDSSFGKRMSAIYGKVAINQSSISSSDVKAYKLKLPPLEKQREIAATLSTWDRAIELHDKLIALKEKQKQGLMQVLLTGKKRLLDDNGLPFSGEWGNEKLSSLCTIKTGKKDVNEGCKDGAYPFFTCANEPTRSNSFSYDCEALLIAGNGLVGRTHYYNGKFEAYQRTYILSNFNKTIDTKFLHQYILFGLGLEVEKGKQHGAMPYIKIGLLQAFDVPTPKIIEQQKIASTFSAADNEIQALKHKRDLLIKQKQGLMQQLLG